MSIESDFEAWLEENKKYTQPQDFDAWMFAAYQSATDRAVRIVEEFAEQGKLYGSCYELISKLKGE